MVKDKLPQVVSNSLLRLRNRLSLAEQFSISNNYQISCFLVSLGLTGSLKHILDSQNVEIFKFFRLPHSHLSRRPLKQCLLLHKNFLLPNTSHHRHSLKQLL